MQKLTSILLAAVLLLSCTVTAFAAEDDPVEIGVYAKSEYSIDGEYTAPVENGSASATTPEGTVSVTNAPANAATLVVIPMKGEALSWVDSCVDEAAQAAYAIYFVDASGNQINASGAKVSITVSGTELTVSSVNKAGEDKLLTSTVSGGKVSFTADSNPYFVIAKKSGGEQPSPGDTVTVPVRGDDNEIHADVTITEEDTVELHELDEEEIEHIVGDDVSTGVVEIDLTGLSEDITKIVLPVTTVEMIVEAAEEAHNDTKALQIDFPSGSVKLDDKAMRAVVEQAECNEVMLVLENVGETRLNDAQDAAIADWNVYGGYEAYLLCVSTNKRISDFQGGVATLSVPFTVPTELDANKFSVWYVADDGSTAKLDTHYANGQLVWDVSHFSDFIIVYEGELPHEHSYEKVVTAPTCTEKGYTTYTCACGDSYVADYTDPTGHSFTKYESNNDATCKKDGTETAKCDHGCGETDTRTDKGSKLGHKYEDGKCIRCGASQWIPETGDDSNIFLWAGILVLSLIALFFLVFWNRRKKDEA